MAFEFATAARIVFGPGTVSQVPAAVAALGRRALLVTGRRPEPSQPLAQALEQAGVAVQRFAVTTEPEIATVDAGAALARDFGAEVVVALGGGSALDTGKAIAAIVGNGGAVLDYLEVIGGGRPLEKDGLPFVAVPTTAGTGSEVTRNAVLGSPEHGVKASLRSPRMLARLAVVDPELTYSMPPAVTASTGADALSQLLEPFVSNAANPITDALCRAGLPLVGRALRRAHANGADTAAREDMALASLLGGLALANARLGAVHGLAGPLGGRLPAAPHGALCGRLLPFVTEANVLALLSRAPTAPALDRYAEAAQLLTGRPDATVSEGVAWLQETAQLLQLPPLADYGLLPADIPEVVPLAQRANSMRGNPISLTDAEVAEVLRQAL